MGVLGFCAGAVGGLVATALLAPQPVTFIGGPTRRPSLAMGEDSSLPALAPITAAVVDVFHVGRDEALPVRRSRAERTGRGVVLTSDGWIVTVADALPTRRSRRSAVASHDGRLHAVARVAFDPISRLVFLQVPTLEAPVLPLRDVHALSVGMPLLVPTDDGGAMPLTVRMRSVYRNPGTVRSSDVWGGVLALNVTEPMIPGTPIVDGDGAIVGIAVDAQYALPMEALQSTLASLFADGVVTRNALGISYEHVGDFVQADPSARDGVILASDGAMPLFSSASPLKGKVVAGDTIVAIGDDPLTARRGLAELLQEYPLGATVTVRTLHDRAARTLEVTLARMSGEVIVYHDGTAPAAAQE